MLNHSMSSQDEISLDTPPKRRLVFLHYILIIVVILLIYSNTFDVPFQFDDYSTIIENPIIKDFSYFVWLLKLKGAQHNYYASRYIGYFTFALNYKVGGLEVSGYHIVNLLIHIANALLMYALVVLSFRTPLLQKSDLEDHSRLIALFSALIFACHPVETQAVTYITQRFTSLALFFYLLSLTLYIRWRLASLRTFKPLILYALSVLSAALAMRTKEIAFTLPLLILLYEFFFFENSFKRKVLYLIAPLLTLLIIPLTLMSLNMSVYEVIGDVTNVARLSTDISRADYLFTQFRVIVTYIRLLLMPINQNLDYHYPLYQSFLNPQVLVSFLLIVGIFCLAVFLYYRSKTADSVWRFISFGIISFFVALSVESSFIPIRDVIFEHRVYLPSIGFFLALTASVFMLIKKIYSKRIRKAAILSLVLILLMLSYATYARNRVWQTGISLWEDVVSKSPQKARVHSALGNEYVKQGLNDEAIEHFKTALKINPNYVSAFLNLGILYQQKDMLDEAIEQFETALKVPPGYYGEVFNHSGIYAQAHNYLGIAYKAKGMNDMAIGQFEASLRKKRSNLKAHINLGILYQQKGMLDKAIRQFEAALIILPGSAEINYYLGTAYGQKGILEKAIDHFGAAVKMKPSFVEAHNNLGYTYFLKGQIDTAIEHYQQALNIKPESALIHYNLYMAYDKKGLLDKAKEHLQKAKSLGLTLGR